MKLIDGAGSPTTGACWMSAIRYYESNCDAASWSDHPECVSPIIRALCIRLNDGCASDEEREELIGPHLFDPVGTAGNTELDFQRAFRAADMAVRVWAPRALRAGGILAAAESLTRLDPIVDTATAREAGLAARGVADNAAAAANVDLCAGIAATAIFAADAAQAAMHVGAAASRAAADAGRTAVAANIRQSRVELRDLIVELCSWSNRPDLDGALTKRVLVEACHMNAAGASTV